MIFFRMFKASACAGLLSLFLVPLASGQLAPTQRVPRNEPLETYDNPPAAPRSMGSFPGLNAPAHSARRAVCIDTSGRHVWDGFGIHPVIEEGWDGTTLQV